MSSHQPCVASSGPTPIEILFLLELVGWLVAGVVVYVNAGVCSYPPKLSAERDVASLLSYSELYRVQHGACPKSLEDLVAAGTVKRNRKDPWGNEYMITCAGIHGEIGVASAGPDGRFATPDDVTSWSDDDQPRKFPSSRFPSGVPIDSG